MVAHECGSNSTKNVTLAVTTKTFAETLKAVKRTTKLHYEKCEP